MMMGRDIEHTLCRSVLHSEEVAGVVWRGHGIGGHHMLVEGRHRVTARQPVQRWRKVCGRVVGRARRFAGATDTTNGGGGATVVW